MLCDSRMKGEGFGDLDSSLFFFFFFFVSLFGEKVDDAGGRDGDYYIVINRRWMFMHSEEM